MQGAELLPLPLGLFLPVLLLPVLLLLLLLRFSSNEQATGGVSVMAVNSEVSLAATVTAVKTGGPSCLARF